MTDTLTVPEIALRELRKTAQLTQNYIARADRDPEILRDYGKDILEDIASLEKFKAVAPLKDRPEEVAEALSLIHI